MNCNRETVGTNVFCEHCQQAMEGFPVPKGTPVIIPNTPSPAASRKQSTHLYASADEQLNITRRTVRFLARSLIFTSVLLILAVAALAYIAIFGLPAFLA
jgi:hypothetical protein